MTACLVRRQTINSQEGWVGGSLGSLEIRSELILTQNAVRQRRWHENLKSLASRKNSLRDVLKIHSICLYYLKWATMFVFWLWRHPSLMGGISLVLMKQFNSKHNICKHTKIATSCSKRHCVGGGGVAPRTKPLMSWCLDLMKHYRLLNT